MNGYLHARLPAWCECRTVLDCCYMISRLIRLIRSNYYAVAVAVLVDAPPVSEEPSINSSSIILPLLIDVRHIGQSLDDSIALSMQSRQNACPHLSIVGTAIRSKQIVHRRFSRYRHSTTSCFCASESSPCLIASIDPPRFKAPLLSELLQEKEGDLEGRDLGWGLSRRINGTGEGRLATGLNRCVDLDAGVVLRLVGNGLGRASNENVRAPNPFERASTPGERA